MVFNQILKKAGFPVARRGAVLVERRLLEEFAQKSQAGPQVTVKKRCLLMAFERAKKCRVVLNGFVSFGPSVPTRAKRAPPSVRPS